MKFSSSAASAFTIMQGRRVAPVPVTFPNHNEGAPGPSQLGTGVDVR